MKRSYVGAAILLLAGARGSAAAGFALYDQSARGIGMGGAFTAQASDPSAIFHNAAGIAFQRQRQLSIGTSLFTLSTDFTGDDPYPGAGREESLDIAVPVPVGYYVHPVGERVALGLGVFAPFGLKTEWNDPDFSGRFISRVARLDAVAVNPTVAYRVSDRLAVGGGVDVRITSVQLERDVPFPHPFTGALLDVASARLESDTTVDVGFNLGVLVRPGGGLSLGAAYRHRVTADFTGQADFTPRPTGSAPIDAVVRAVLPAQPVPLRTAIAFPGIASVGAAYRTGDWTVEADVNWYQWSTFEQLVLDFEGRHDLDQTIREEYENSWQYRVGAERALGPTWAIRGGYYYDQSPAPAASVSPILPDPNRHALAIGGSWISRRLRVDGALGYVIGRDRSTEGVNRDGYDGTYRSTGFVLSAFLGYAF
jgi:long-chain fatty acid transport protein